MTGDILEDGTMRLIETLCLGDEFELDLWKTSDGTAQLSLVSAEGKGTTAVGVDIGMWLDRDQVRRLQLALGVILEAE